MSATTYLMSYPGRNWQIRGGQNFRSQQRTATNPRKAFREWLNLCDAIVRAGGHILVMPPPTDEESDSAPADSATTSTGELTGMIYTANAGQLFKQGDEWLYLVSNMAVPHRRDERLPVRLFVERAGIAARDAIHTWEGQADLQTLGGNRYIATWGVRSVEPSVDEIRPLLAPAAKLLSLQIKDPFFHGDTCLDLLENRAGHALLLAHQDAFVDPSSLATIRNFLGDRAEVLPIDSQDALGYAANALCVNGTVLLPEGLSTSLRGYLVKRGFLYEELALTELFGKGGGGPRCLVNELRGLVVNPGAPDYASLRDSLYKKVETWPESAVAQ